MKHLRNLLIAALACLIAWSFFPRKAKVFDCFPFFNEFEILQTRLRELDEVVDYFVLVESIETQRGHRKPLYFEENKHLFAPYLHKIIPIAIRKEQPGKPGWGREHHQRNCIARGLKGRCKSKDLILISDVDEIPRKEAVLEAKLLLEQGAPAVRLRQKMFYYKLNMQNVNEKTHGGIDWFGTVVTTYKVLQQYKKPQYLRDRRETPEWPCIWEGGWHFSSAGPNHMIRTKLFSVIEGSDFPPSDEDLQKIFDGMKVVAIDDSFPIYIRENLQRLQDLGFVNPLVK